jgi:Homeobox KN domain
LYVRDHSEWVTGNKAKLVKQWIKELRERPEFRQLNLPMKTLTEFVRQHEKKFETTQRLAAELGIDLSQAGKDIEFVFADKPRNEHSARRIKSLCQYYDLLHPVLTLQRADMSSDFTLASESRSPQSSLSPASGSESFSSSSSPMRDDLCSSANSRSSPEIESSYSTAVKETCSAPSTDVTIEPNPRCQVVPATGSTSAIDITLDDSISANTLYLSTNPIFPPIQDNSHRFKTTLLLPSVRNGGTPSLPSQNVSNSAVGFVRFSSTSQNTTGPLDSPRYSQLTQDFEMLDVGDENNAMVGGPTEPFGVGTPELNAKPMEANYSALIILRNVGRQKYARDCARKLEIETTLRKARETVVLRELRSACVDYLSQCGAGDKLGKFEGGPVTNSTFELRRIQNLVAFGLKDSIDETGIDARDLPVFHAHNSGSIWDQNPTLVRELHSTAVTTAKLCRSRLRLLQRLNPSSDRSKQSSSLRRRLCLEQSHSKKVLVSWYLANSAHPYPSKTEKLKLAKESGFTMRKVNQWFLNARCRVKRGMHSHHGCSNEGRCIKFPGFHNRGQYFSGANSPPPIPSTRGLCLFTGRN